MKFRLPILFVLLLPIAANAQSSRENGERQIHYVYIEANMPYDTLGNPGAPFLHIGEIAKNYLNNYPALEQKVGEYQSTMDILNYLDEQGFEMMDRTIFQYSDGMTESFILRKER